MSEITYYVASTLDGVIAHEDGSFEDFAGDDEVVSDFFSDLEQFQTVLMGRKTYEVGLEEGKTSPYPGKRQIVFSRTLKESPDAEVELVSGDIVDFVRTVKSEASAPIWLCGGSELASTLLNAGLVDNLTLKLNPVLFGSGVPLVGSMVDLRSLELTETKTYDCGIAVLHYTVSRETA